MKTTIQKRERIRRELDNLIIQIMDQTGLSRLEVLKEMKVRLEEVHPSHPSTVSQAMN
jgi:hypothetical protein